LFLNVPKSIAEFRKTRKNSSKYLARGRKRGLTGEMRPCNESVLEFKEMRRESRWEGRERDLLGRWEGHRPFIRLFVSQAHITRSAR
jgi:hypothetical protein